jgi:hypothetical protein
MAVVQKEKEKEKEEEKIGMQIQRGYSRDISPHSRIAILAGRFGYLVGLNRAPSQ